MVKNLPAMWKTQRFDPWVGKIPWRREWLPTPVFSTGEFCGQRSLVGYSPWSHKESDTTKQHGILTSSFRPSRDLKGFILTAAAKSLQSCPTLCDPIDGSPPGSPVPRILQARTLDSCPSSQSCHPAISPSVVPFSCPQSLPASESFPLSQLFA